MRIHFLFSSSEGDIVADETLLSRPFLLNPHETHPSLRLGDYFNAIEHVLFQNNGQVLSALLCELWKKPVHTADIQEVLIRSEKHGTLYHLASVEIIGPGSRSKFAVSTAVQEANRQWLAQEFETLRHLGNILSWSYLPVVHFLETLDWPTPQGGVSLSIMLSEWFEDYHEWHLTKTAAGDTGLVIWDLQRGYRMAAEWESRQIYRQASKILTLYYDLRTSHHIHPWHHAAGDFIVKSGHEIVDLKLTTARGYEPLVVFLEDQDINPIMALVYFLLDLSIRMRLDRWEGVGRLAWAPDFCVQPTVEGFFEAMTQMASRGRYSLGSLPDLSSLLKTFRRREFHKLYRQLMDLYRHEGEEMGCLVKEHLEEHCAVLERAIQGDPG